MERMNFKKFYKFVVSKPFEIQPRFPYVEVSRMVFKQIKIKVKVIASV